MNVKTQEIYDVNAWRSGENQVTASVYATNLNANGLRETNTRTTLASIITNLDPDDYEDEWWQTDDPEMPEDVRAVVTAWLDTKEGE